MELVQKYPGVVIAVVVVAVILLGWSAWSALAPPRSNPTAGKMGPITPMSSMLGPDRSGAPRTTGTPGQPPGPPPAAPAATGQ
jgi:hypothetical protein